MKFVRRCGILFALFFTFAGSPNDALGQLPGMGEHLTDQEFVVLVCFGQGLLDTEKVIREFDLRSGDRLPGNRCECRNLNEGSTGLCEPLNSCRASLQRRFLDYEFDRDGDYDGMPCENLCMPKESLLEADDQGRRAWNCQVLKDLYYPGLDIDSP